MKPRLDAIGTPHVDAELPGGLRLMWDTVETVRSFDPGWQPPLAGGPKIALAFRLDTPSEVDATFERLVSLGHKAHKEPWDADWGMRYSVIVDPDGNPTSTCSARRRSRRWTLIPEAMGATHGRG